MMLALALHEPRVLVLREQVTKPERRNKRGDKGPPAAESAAKSRKVAPMQFLFVARLRQYLANELSLIHI